VLAENLQETGQGWILIVLAPVRGIADAGWLGAIAHLAINQPSDDGAGARFRQQRNSKSRADKAHQTPATDVVAHDLGAVDGRRRLRNQEIMKLRSGITPAQQDRLILEVDPVDSLSIGKRMSPAPILRGTLDSKMRSTTIGACCSRPRSPPTLLSIGSEAGADRRALAQCPADDHDPTRLPGSDHRQPGPGA